MNDDLLERALLLLLVVDVMLLLEECCASNCLFRIRDGDSNDGDSDVDSCGDSGEKICCSCWDTADETDNERMIVCSIGRKKWWTLFVFHFFCVCAMCLIFFPPPLRHRTHRTQKHAK